jgi:hypothetical protein
MTMAIKIAMITGKLKNKYNLMDCQIHVSCLKSTKKTLTSNIVETKHQSASCETIRTKLLHRPGIEPGPPAWQASILPLNQRCLIDMLFY